MSVTWNCVGLGLCAFDYLLVVNHYPQLNQKTDAVAFSHQGGGPVATALATLGRLELEKIAFVGKVGNDRNGEYIRQALQFDDVDTGFVKVVEDAKSAQAFVWIEQGSGNRSVVLYKDSKLIFSEDEIEPEPFNQTKYLLIDGRDTDAALKAAHITKQSGGKVVMDAGGLRLKMTQFFRVVDYFVCSNDFLSAVGRGGSHKATLDKIHRAGCHWVVATLGEAGSIGFDGENFFSVPAFPVSVADTTGAGDVYHGAFIFGLLQKWQLPEVMRFANAVAALKCRKLGGRDGIPTLQEVKSFLRAS